MNRTEWHAHPRHVPEPDHDVTLHTLALLALVAVPGAVALYFVIALALAVLGYPLPAAAS